MELGTFGVILKFAMEIEEEVNKFYSVAKGIVKSSDLIALFDSLLIRGEKRLKTLERVRRENVTEMILEPVIGLDSNDYEMETEVLSSAEEDALKGQARTIEKNLFTFYSQAAEKIDFLIEASYAFELLAEANESALQKLS